VNIEDARLRGDKMKPRENLRFFWWGRILIFKLEIGGILKKKSVTMTMLKQIWDKIEMSGRKYNFVGDKFILMVCIGKREFWLSPLSQTSADC
jgi:hypothetical protein